MEEKIFLDVNEVKDDVLEEVAGGAKYYEIYTVEKGDNLHKIARLYSVKWQDIYKLNKAIIGDDPNFIKPGMKLKIPNN